MFNRIDPKTLEPAAVYLRKSREDQEAESRGEGETLAKHKKAMFQHAKTLGVTITHIFEEVVSGESLFHRPEMLRRSARLRMESGDPSGAWTLIAWDAVTWRTRASFSRRLRTPKQRS